MDLTWNERQLELRDRYRSFGAEHLNSDLREREKRGEFNSAAWKELASAGLWGLNVPPEYGGVGGSLWDFLAALEGLALGSEDSGFVLSAVAHAGLVQVLREHGTDCQKETLLPSLLTGALGATAATEPTGGSHVAAVKTTISRGQDGMRINGRKAHITNAPQADWILLVARIPELGKRDITLVVTDTRRDGVTLGQHEDLLGQRTSPTGPVVLDNVLLTDEDIVGPPGDGLRTLYSFLAFDRLMYGIVVAAQVESRLPELVRHVLSRESFGSPLADHQLVQEKLVQSRLAIEGARHLAYAAAAALERNDDTFSSLASCAKLLASEGGVLAALEAIQLFGHAGYEREQPHERHLRDAVAIRIAGGTTEMQKKNIAKDTLVRFGPTNAKVS